ncbi:hypothetical protein BVX94_01620 [bacterium B17]|nr:hypothetical protein BVX94_01620 [bacterium B17]
MIIFVLILHGAHTLYVRHRDRNFDLATEAEAARHFAVESSQWVKEMLEEQRIKLAQKTTEPEKEAAVPMETNSAPAITVKEVVPEVPAYEHNRRNRNIFKRTINTLSETESLLTEDIEK